MNRTMNLFHIFLVLQFLGFIVTLKATQFISDVSINCGSKGNSKARNGREWLGDMQLQLSYSLLQLKGPSAAAVAIRKLTSADAVPHKNARISLSKFSYAFQVHPGQKIIRLHFNPTSYKGFKGLKDLFTVEAGPFVLLGNFSASLTAHTLRVESFVKEFCLCIQENEQFDIVFTPENGRSIKTYAFVNGIEIISVPAGLSYFQDGDIGLQAVGHKSHISVDNTTVLEIVHRLNIKQDFVSSHGDDLFPKWTTQKANKIKTNKWIVQVDVGFRYLIRLHFSEVGLNIVGTRDMMFEVVINDLIAYTSTDKLKERDENNILWYRDYMVTVKGLKKKGKQDILISFKSYDELIDCHLVFTGFEIVKLSNTDNSLASPNPLAFPQSSPPQVVRILHSILGYKNLIAAAGITIISLANIIIHKLRENWESSQKKKEKKPSGRGERLCRRFSLMEIDLATRNFNDGLVIGSGGFGRVYKGLIDKGQKTVAIKRLKLDSKQGAREFVTEIKTLSKVRHVNLISLIGYCNENEEMILVYEYVGGGTLADHLYELPRESIDSSSLTWKQRLKICIGAARGLDYLHTSHGVIHRDVKASNILLDGNLVAKVCDFGLAKAEDRSKLLSHVSTNVKGTFGYFDPSYFRTRKLTRKSDTYSFGVVLLEVLCGRAAVDSNAGEDERYLPWWVRDKIGDGEVDQIVDLSLREEISQDSLKTFIEVAQRCLYDEPENRPIMSHVVVQLEFALEQHESKQNFMLNEIASVSSNETSLLDNARYGTMSSTYTPNFTLPSKEQTKRNMVSAYHGRKATTLKTSRVWSRGTFWNRVKQSKKSQMPLSENCEEIYEAEIKLAKLDWVTIAAATNHFSRSNIVGHGGFGKVYKAVLPTGQKVAVKRRSPSSAQGLEEFKNEIFLLPNLQHRNIIKLLGYCIHGDENLLVYEFMENTSLDTFIDDAKRQRLQWLLWPVRFKIIIGIARGLVYLHQDSGLRVIYRDLKSRNILLDIDMNPKITDFDFARTLVEHQHELETTRVAGTSSSYMPPEYVTEGRFSIKSDVYSFGIIVLEILSSRRVWDLTNKETMMFLPSYAWKLWNEKNPLNLVDNLLGGAFSVDEALRCIQVGLLCTQQDPNCRPEMPSVLKILEGEEPQVELQVQAASPSRERSSKQH